MESSVISVTVDISSLNSESSGRGESRKHRVSRLWARR